MPLWGGAGYALRVTSDTQPSFLTEDDLERELATARRETDRLLTAVRDFHVVLHSSPWMALDDLLADLRASAITVSTIDGILARRE